MKISVNVTTVESESNEAAISAAIQTFYRFDGSELILPDLETVRAWAFAHLNTWRGTSRATIGLTSAEWQQLCYTGKALECQRWKSAQETNFGLSLEAEARGITNLEMANLVLEQWSVWQAGSDKIEATWVTTSRALESAASIEEIAGILADLG